MEGFRYALLKLEDRLEFVEMPATYMYQLTALIHRLYKEIGKLTAGNAPKLPRVIMECDNLEITDPDYPLIGGLEYINQLERIFASTEETSYPLVSLLTEIRALQAQLEQWYEEYEEEQASNTQAK